VVDRSYREGDPITAWFGPQPNHRAFLNYGIVDEDNPHDKMSLEVSHLFSTPPLPPCYVSLSSYYGLPGIGFRPILQSEPRRSKSRW
jgi:hypothetical protein